MQLYMLTDPRGWAYCYVGMSKDAGKRWQEHCQDVYGHTRKATWIRCLRREGLRPQLHVLDPDVPECDAAIAETDAIAMVKAVRGTDCLNSIVRGWQSRQTHPPHPQPRPYRSCPPLPLQ